MFDPSEVIQKAKTSRFHLWLLNFTLSRTIPFNIPHGFEILTLEDNRLFTKLPYKRKNLNHIKGMHACALATLSEFTTGFLLISRLGMKKYRIILQRLEMDYHFQGKMDAFGEFIATEEWLNTEIFTPLQTQDSVVINCEIKIKDAKGNHLTTGHVYWQIKDWQKVKTKT
jgi:acyl-coenzyme A thioesterase PaaI-like protein